MGGLCRPQTVAAVLIGASVTWLNSPTLAGDPAGFVPRYPGSQIMLYMTRAIGAHGAGASTFGLRYERATPVSSDPGAYFCAPLRHRSLVELQFGRGMAPRMQFGPKVTWDMGRRKLEPTSLAATAWPMSIQQPAGVTLAAWAP